MRISSWLAIGLAVASLTFSVPLAFAEKIEASVLYRQDSDNRYIAVVPGYSGPDADITRAACSISTGRTALLSIPLRRGEKSTTCWWAPRYRCCCLTGGWRW